MVSDYRLDDRVSIPLLASVSRPSLKSTQSPMGTCRPFAGGKVRPGRDSASSSPWRLHGEETQLFSYNYMYAVSLKCQHLVKILQRYKKCGTLNYEQTHCARRDTVSFDFVVHHLRFVHSTVVFLHPKLSFAICLCL
jgi:hypothetical protein